LVQEVASLGWWFGAMRAAAAHAAGSALVIGGYARLLVAALSYFAPVLVGGGRERLEVSFRLTRSWVSLTAGNVAAAAAFIAIPLRPSGAASVGLTARRSSMSPES
jgi:hypothetical protein